MVIFCGLFVLSLMSLSLMSLSLMSLSLSLMFLSLMSLSLMSLSLSLVLALSSLVLSFPATMELNVMMSGSYVSCFKFAENLEDDSASSSAPNKFKSISKMYQN